MTQPLNVKFEQLGQIHRQNIPKQTCGFKYKTKLAIMATTTCHNHAVKFMATEQHLLIEIYGHFKHLISKKGQISALLINKAKEKDCQEIGTRLNENRKLVCY